MQVGREQAKRLGVKPRVQQSPLLELCCLTMAAKGSYASASDDVERLTGMKVSAKTVERIVARNPIASASTDAPVSEVALDGGMVRLVTAKGEASEWKQYKAVRIEGDCVGMAWFDDHQALIDWMNRLAYARVVFCLGDGHRGIWSLFAQMETMSKRDEILDWFHLMENLHKVGGSLKRLTQARDLLWQGKVDETLELFEGLKSQQARCFRGYLEGHRSRIVNYSYYQQEGLPIGSGAVESLIKQIDARVQVTGAQWKAENVPQMLALRCAYLNHQLDLYSLSSG